MYETRVKNLNSSMVPYSYGRTGSHDLKGLSQPFTTTKFAWSMTVMENLGPGGL